MEILSIYSCPSWTISGEVLEVHVVSEKWPGHLNRYLLLSFEFTSPNIIRVRQIFRSRTVSNVESSQTDPNCGQIEICGIPGHRPIS